MFWGERRSATGFRLWLRLPFNCSWVCGSGVCNLSGSECGRVIVGDCMTVGCTVVPISSGSVLVSLSDGRQLPLLAPAAAHSSTRGTNISTCCGVCSASSRAG